MAIRPDRASSLLSSPPFTSGHLLSDLISLGGFSLFLHFERRSGFNAHRLIPRSSTIGGGHCRFASADQSLTFGEGRAATLRPIDTTQQDKENSKAESGRVPDS